MSLPEDRTTSLDRHTLPVVTWADRGGIRPRCETEARRASEDLDYLVRMGIIEPRFSRQVDPNGSVIPEPTPEDFAEGCELLDKMYLRGVFADYVRRTGLMYACPDWCRSTDHPREGIYHPTDGAPMHCVLWPDRAGARAAVTLMADAPDDEGAEILIMGSAEGLNAATAQALAGDLAAAAALLAQIERDQH